MTNKTSSSESKVEGPFSGRKCKRVKQPKPIRPEDREIIETRYTFRIPKELLTMPLTFYRIDYDEEEGEPVLIVEVSPEGEHTLVYSNGDPVAEGTTSQCDGCGIFMVRVDHVTEDMLVAYTDTF
jgi:hypothetical protein